MSKENKPTIDQHLLAAWRRTLPETLGDKASVDIHSDEQDPYKLLIHITVAGRNDYTLDFTCTYLDTREVQVDFINVVKYDHSVDEHTNIIQDLIKDLTRDIHECAQSLHPITQGS